VPAPIPKKPPAGLGWIHEIKHDGFRIIAVRDGARVRLLTRKGIDLARRFPKVAAVIAALPVRSCVIDGEAIACGLAVPLCLTAEHRQPCPLLQGLGEPRG
jgi:bifunctional non-homologous end joining protein LigD